MRPSQISSAAASTRPQLSHFYSDVRALSTAIAEPLSAEDTCVQPMPDASPMKWHLAHTTWFFERMILRRDPNYEPFDAQFDAIFNSYYLGLGAPFARANRGLLTRPGLAEVYAYRSHVDEAMERLLPHAGPERRALVTLGLHHEQQHQELMLTDIKYTFFCNPLLPAMRAGQPSSLDSVPALDWIAHSGGVVEIGHAGGTFAFDNEGPQHEVLLRPFRLASRPITCGEYQAFIEDGGYGRSEFWLSDGWALKEREGWTAPLYWLEDDRIFTLHGVRPRNPGEPVAHVSFYEAAAFAAWAGKRLPTECEWEVAAVGTEVTGNLMDSGLFRPAPLNESGRNQSGDQNGVQNGNQSGDRNGVQNGLGQRAAQLFGDCWEWTASAYLGYPGFKPLNGSLGEYNGKFMSGQMVLRGGSCVTPQAHIRSSYRNFFPPETRWQFSGIRLANL